MKLKKYRKKKKKDTSLVFLEYGSELELEDKLVFEPELVLEVLELLQLKSLSSYKECQQVL